MAMPQLPQAFYGTVTISGQPAPTGTVVEAFGTGVLNPDRYGRNPLTTYAVGTYGGAGGFSPKLVVQAAYPAVIQGPIYFFVNGQLAEFQHGDQWLLCYPWQSGQVTELNLRV